MPSAMDWMFLRTLHDDDFQTVLMIEMNVCGRQHCGPRVMLHLGQFARNVGNVVIVDKSQGAHDWLVRGNGLS
jgi:hypothetical protein